jgi:hypothetical protein
MRSLASAGGFLPNILVMFFNSSPVKLKILGPAATSREAIR